MDSQANEASLSGRVALVTGVSRRRGIGRAVADHLAARGATVVASGWRPHDAEMAWGAEPRHGGSAPGGYVVEQHDLADPEVPGALVDRVVDRHGALDVVVAVHARTGWATGATHAAVARGFPTGRWTTPDQIAEVVALLLGDGAAAIQGQVIDAEAGFRRWAAVPD